MSGLTRILQGKVAQGKTRGKAYIKAISSALSPSNIAKQSPKGERQGKK